MSRYFILNIVNKALFIYAQNVFKKIKDFLAKYVNKK